MNFVGVSDGGDLQYNHKNTRPADIVEHPVEAIQKNHGEIANNLEMTSYRHIYGAHYPAFMQMQEQYLDSVGRAPHLPSSKIALEIFRGDDENIDFCDMLGDEESSRGQLDAHIAMEKKLGIQIKSAF